MFFVVRFTPFSVLARRLKSVYYKLKRHYRFAARLGGLVTPAERYWKNFLLSSLLLVPICSNRLELVSHKLRERHGTAMMTWDRSSHPRSRLPQTQREVRKDASTHPDTDMKPPPVKERQPSQLEYHADKERQPSQLESPVRCVCMHAIVSLGLPACLPVWASSPGNPEISFATHRWVSSSFLFRQNETSGRGWKVFHKGNSLRRYTLAEREQILGLFGWKVTRLDQSPKGGSRQVLVG